MSGEKERVTRLETRAREAENALQQLRTYIELLRRKATEPNTGAFTEEAQQLECENNQLKLEVESLKKQLITLEIRNGVPQIPVPSSAPLTAQLSSTATPPKVDAPTSTSTTTTTTSTASGATGGTEASSTDSKKKEKASKSKTEKSAGKREKKGAAAAEAAPVDVSRLDLRIGKIIRAWKHPDADSLFIEEVDVGEEKSRSVCSGLVGHVPLEEMQERMAMFLCNLKPAKMRGVPSEAMVMCASTPEKVEILEPPPGCVPGDRVICEGYTGEPDTLLNPKKKVWDNVQPDLHTNVEGVACYKETPLSVEGKGVFRAPTLRGTPIK